MSKQHKSHGILVFLQEIKDGFYGINAAAKHNQLIKKNHFYNFNNFQNASTNSSFTFPKFSVL